MKRSRFTEEQIIGVLREHEAAAKTGDLARKHGDLSGGRVSGACHGPSAFHRDLRRGRGRRRGARTPAARPSVPVDPHVFDGSLIYDPAGCTTNDHSRPEPNWRLWEIGLSKQPFAPACRRGGSRHCGHSSPSAGGADSILSRHPGFGAERQTWTSRSASRPLAD